MHYLAHRNDREVVRVKKVLISNVLYRLQAPFMPEFEGKAFDMPLEERLEKINKQQRLMYYFQRMKGHLHNGLDTVIIIDATGFYTFERIWQLWRAGFPIK